jgi:hypothetical protein
MPTLPGVGKVPKGWLIAVGGGSVLVLGYVWYKHKNAAAASTTSTTPTATSGDQYPPDGTTGNPSDPYSTDPNTGMTYGDEQLYGGGYGGTGYGGYPGGYPGSPGSPGAGGPGGPPFTDNAAWATYAEQQLAGIVDPTALSAALGVYLTGRPASSSQVSLIDQAIAIAGYPPVAGTSPAGYPPAIKQGGGGNPGGGGTTVPNVVGQNWMGAIKQISTAGFKPSPAAKPANAKDPITGQQPAGGTQASKGSTVTLTSPTR